tara:strand:- start:1153 stop:3681 length:2529 start_codon:yes stop_codon:yes gene_type:complete
MNNYVPAIRFSLPLLLTIGMSACGGGGGSNTATQINAASVNPLFSIEGNIEVSPGSLVDSDINNSEHANISNNSPSEAQDLPSFAVLGGYVNQAMQGADGPLFQLGDPSDYYKIHLYEGQSIVLDIYDTANADLDLYLLDSTGLTVFDSSLSTSSSESLIAPFEGDFQLLVEAFSGASNYNLRTEQTLNISSTGFRLSDAFVPNELIVSFHHSDMFIKQQNNPLSHIQRLGLSHLAGHADRPMRLGIRNSALPQRRTQQSTGSLDTTSIDKRHQFYSAEVKAKYATLLAVKVMALDPDVQFAEPNLIIEGTAVPNDSRYAEQWNYPFIDLPAAWDTSTGSSDVIVAVIDSGALYQHPDLAANLIAGYDFISDVSNAADGDGIDADAEDKGSSFHGSHVAGIIAGRSNNGIGTSGASWQTSIMPLRVLGVSGGNLYDAAQAIRYAAGLANDSGTLPNRTANIINLSIGGTGYCPDSYRELLGEVRKKNILVVTAAGNGGSNSNQFIPANCNDVINVSAVDQNRLLAPYSNYGSSIDIAAPGGRNDQDADNNGIVDGILSTSASLDSGNLSYDYAYRYGTSMATPHVSAVFALMLAVNPGLSADEIEQMLVSGLLTDDIGISGADSSFGYGLINASKAVSTALDSLISSPVLDSYLSSSISSFEFRPAVIDTTFETRTIGDDAVTINNISYNADWLSLLSLGQQDGVENWRLNISRSGLSAGLYRDTISFDTSANTLNIDVILQVNPAAQPYSLGPVIVDLLNTQSGTRVQSNARFVNGVYTFKLDNLPQANYRFSASSDLNGSGLADAGEAFIETASFTLTGDTVLPNLRLEWSGLLIPNPAN